MQKKQTNNQDLAPAMAPGHFRMILKKLRPPALKHQASSAKLQAPDPEGIRNFSQQKNI